MQYWKCQICGEIFKRRSAIHVEKKHNMPWELYLQEYEIEEFLHRQLIDLFNSFYITTRYKFLEYLPQNEGTPITTNIHKNKKENELLKAGEKKKREYSLNDKDLKDHLLGKRTIGIFFPLRYTKVIGLDIDRKEKEFLIRVYKALKNLGVEDCNMILSHSGNKGWHIDVVLQELVDVEIVKKFYRMILLDAELTNNEVELRGASAQGYKLPHGCHFKTNAKAYITNEYAKELSDREVLDTIQEIRPLKIEDFKDIVEINWETYLEEEQILEFEEIQEEVKMLDTYENTVELRAAKVREILEKGLHINEHRNNTVFEVSMYLKDIEGLCLADTKKYINNWIKTKWTQSILDKDFVKGVNPTVESVYKHNHTFIGARTIKISRADIREIFTINTKNKLKDKALRRLYYILLIHSRAYANKDTSVFYMSYLQMQEMGAVSKNSFLKQQIEDLQKLGKVLIVSKNKGTKGTYIKQANRYKLLNLVDQEISLTDKVFTICKDEKCVDCIEKAFCYLTNDKERRKFIKGKDYKQLEECRYNKNE